MEKILEMALFKIIWKDWLSEIVYALTIVEKPQFHWLSFQKT